MTTTAAYTVEYDHDHDATPDNGWGWYGRLTVTTPDGRHYELVKTDDTGYDYDGRQLTVEVAVAAGLASDDLLDIYNADDHLPIDELADSARERLGVEAALAEDAYYDDAAKYRADTAAEALTDYSHLLLYSPRGFANEVWLYGVNGQDEADKIEAQLTARAGATWSWLDKDEADHLLQYEAAIMAIIDALRQPKSSVGPRCHSRNHSPVIANKPITRRRVSGSCIAIIVYGRPLSVPTSGLGVRYRLTSLNWLRSWCRHVDLHIQGVDFSSALFPAILQPIR